MFTGLVAEIGTVRGIDASGEGAALRVATPLAADLANGDSVAVNGVCLTVAGRDAGGFSAEVMNQTLGLTSLGGLLEGDRVNLEPALRASDRLGGHIVQGHVDGVGEVAAVRPDGFARRLEVTLDPDLLRFVVEHGSIALDGVSLTVAKLCDGAAEVSLIPETLERTTLGAVEPGNRLNVEVDIVARYAERLLQGFTGRSTDV